MKIQWENFKNSSDCTVLQFIVTEERKETSSVYESIWKKFN